MDKKKMLKTGKKLKAEKSKALSRRDFMWKAGAFSLGAVSASMLSFPNVIREAEPI